MLLQSIFLITFLDIVYSASYLTCADIRKFVDSHNEKRLRIARGEVDGQPPADKMYYMMWDKELASKAAAWASLNKYGHNPNKKLGSGRFKTGENIYMYWSSRPGSFDLEKAMASWFDEYKDYTFKRMEKKDVSKSKATGHYTQMVWANTIYVGCALSKFIKDNNYHNYVVCNYGPPGNFINEYPYVNGTGSGHLACGTDDCSKLYGRRCS